jgi:hypothetical protein
MSIRRDANSPGVLGQLMVLGFAALILGVLGVAGAVSSDWVTRSLGGVLVVLGPTSSFIAYRRLRKK